MNYARKEDKVGEAMEMHPSRRGNGNASNIAMHLKQ